MRKIILTPALVLLVVGLIFLGTAGTLYGFARATLGAVFEARGHALAAERLFEIRDISGAAQSIAQVSGSLARADRFSLRLAPLRAVPWVSRQYRAARSSIAAARAAAEALAKAAAIAANLYAPFENLPQTHIGELDESRRREFLGALAGSLPDLVRAREEMQKAREILDKTSREGLLPVLRDEIDDLDGRVALASLMLDDVVPIATVGAAVLGYPEDSVYLFVLQNSDEMRPAGGFIGTYGVIRFSAGHITDFFTDDVYNLDRFSLPESRPRAPYPIATYLEQPAWYLRDANWDPDFPASAERILRFYKDEFKEACVTSGQAMSNVPCSMLHDDLDGIIAIMPEAIRPLLEMVGPITVGGQTFDDNNLTDALEFEVEIKFEQKGIPRPLRKMIVSELGHALISKIMELPIKRWPEAIHAVRGALDERQMILYASDPGVQEKISSYGWSGKIADAPFDYLAIFDANMFSLKTDPYVKRKVAYNLERTPAGLFAEVSITYSYPDSGPAWKTKGYRNFVRIYVPQGSILNRAQGAMRSEDSGEPGDVTVAQEFGKTVFGAFVAVQSQEEKTLSFKYRLPERIAEELDAGAYALTVQKQAGTVGHDLTVSVNFDKVPRVWEPRGLNVVRDGERLTWQTSLRRDQEFRVEF